MGDLRFLKSMWTNGLLQTTPRFKCGTSQLIAEFEESGDSDWSALHDILSSNLLVRTIIQDGTEDHYTLFFDTCSWTVAFDILEDDSRLPPRLYPEGQDFGSPISSSFYLYPSFQEAIHRLARKVSMPPGSSGNVWGQQGAILIFFVEKSRLQKCANVIDVGSGDSWKNLVARSHRDEPIETPLMTGLISGPQLHNRRSVRMAGTLEAAMVAAQTHEPARLQAAVKGDEFGAVIRQGLVEVVWYSRE